MMQPQHRLPNGIVGDALIVLLSWALIGGGLWFGLWIYWTFR